MDEHGAMPAAIEYDPVLAAIRAARTLRALGLDARCAQGVLAIAAALDADVKPQPLPSVVTYTRRGQIPARRLRVHHVER